MVTFKLHKASGRAYNTFGANLTIAKEVDMSKHQLIMVHGMGEGDSEKEYDELEKRIKKRLKKPTLFEFVRVEWQFATRSAEKTIFDACFPAYAPAPDGLNLLQIPIQPIKSIRYFMTFYVGDIVAYTAENQNGIREAVWNEIGTCCENGKYSLLCHSLGSVIVFDYLYKLFVKDTLLYPGDKKETDEERLKKFKGNFQHLFTFGSPIGLFLMRQGNLWQDKPKPFKDVINPVPNGGHKWLNFYDKQDAAAYPLRSIFSLSFKDKIAGERVEDILIDTGDLVANSHTKYWENNEMAERIANTLNANP